jgi:hypothetical protein
MNRLLTLALIILALVTFDTSRQARAQDVDCGDPRDVPIHHLLCQYAEADRRLDALEALTDTGRLSTAELEGLAWAKANDAIFAKQRAWANPATGDPWLVNFTRQRISRYNCAAGLTSLDVCPVGAIPQP